MTRVPWDTITASVRSETVVTRSRFITTLAPVADAAAVEDCLDAVRHEFPDARHHCSATVLGPYGEQQRSNDDGEPSGTAGAPMLAVLDGAQLTDVVAVVTRYFGGTLLGAGGLVRAYGGAVTEALTAVRRRSRHAVGLLEVRADHDTAGRLEHRMRTWADGRLEVADGHYAPTGASFEVAVPVDLLPAFRSMLAAGGIEYDLEDRGPAIRPEA
jgi:uncharacterized YigZ family protein